MKPPKFQIVKSDSFEAAIRAFQMLVEESWNRIDELSVSNPSHPALPNLKEEGNIMDRILEVFQACAISEKDAMEDIFGPDLMLLSEFTINRFKFGYTDDSEIH